ncbi:MAG: group 1 truncated hemoglobin [Oleibacter sp.]|nr:group 1 truncated hemoglobin [Thalassolituus sp.]
MLRNIFMFVAISFSACYVQADTLYENLGGQAGIANIVDGFLEEISYDREIYPFFAKSNIKRVRSKLEEQFCHLSSGPCVYTGDDMKSVHTGMNIDEAHFNRVVELLQTAMTKADIDFPTQNKLLQKLAPMRADMLHR